MKVSLIYLKETSDLYAWTDSKELLNKFKATRDTSKFIIKKKKYDVVESGKFVSEFKILELTEIPLESKGKSYKFTATYKEDDLLNLWVKIFVDKQEELYQQIKHSKIDPVYKQRLLNALYVLIHPRIRSEEVDASDLFIADTLRIFCNLFKETF